MSKYGGGIIKHKISMDVKLNNGPIHHFLRIRKKTTLLYNIVLLRKLLKN